MNRELPLALSVEERACRSTDGTYVSIRPVSAPPAATNHGHAEHSRAEGREKGAHGPCLFLLPARYASRIRAARQTCATSFFDHLRTARRERTRTYYRISYPAVVQKPAVLSHLAYYRSGAQLVPYRLARNPSPRASRPCMAAPHTLTSFPTPLSRLARRYGSPAALRGLSGATTSTITHHRSPRAAGCSRARSWSHERGHRRPPPRTPRPHLPLVCPCRVGWYDLQQRLSDWRRNWKYVPRWRAWF